MHAVLTRCRINRLSHIDRVTAEPLRRYEHDQPGSLIHVDVTKFGNIPDGGGWRYTGKQQGNKNKAATARRTGRTASRHPRIGTAYIHTVIDDHSRVAYAEICADEKAVTAIGVLQRATAWFAERGVIVQRVLSDTLGPTSPTPGATLAPSSASSTNGPGPTVPRPTARSKDSTAPLADGWAYARFYPSEDHRRAALPGWLHYYNHHRAHSAIGAKPPISRLTNVPGHHS